MTTLEKIARAYLACALWTASDPEDGLPLDREYDVDDFHADAVREASETCADFVLSAGDDVNDLDPEQIGHDLWLTRNSHGAGFWDRGLGEQGKRLTELAHPYGEAYVYVGDDNLLHFE